MTKVALESRLFLLIKFYGIVRACFHAALATSALVVVEDYDAVFSLGNGLFRARFRAWRVVTVPAQCWPVEILPSIPCHPRSVLADVNELHFVIVFLCARDLTGLAAPAQFIIYP